MMRDEEKITLEIGCLYIWDDKPFDAVTDSEYKTPGSRAIYGDHDWCIPLHKVFPGSPVMVMDWRASRPTLRSRKQFEIQVFHDGELYWLLPGPTIYERRVNFRIVELDKNSKPLS